MGGRFKLDENLPRDAEALLREAGHEVETALGEGLGGNADSKIFDACRAEGRILVTLDLDFADIRLYPPSSHPGIWVLRPPALSISNTIALLKVALAAIEKESPKHRLWIVEPGRVRIHE
jgi:predicted nuclease of predicted toxin-antitoxin system